MFREARGAELVYGVADYWVSRVKWNPEDQKYHLLSKTVIYIECISHSFPKPNPNTVSPLGVMPPDEFYRNVNNSVYTNAVAKFRFEFLTALFTVNLVTNIRDGTVLWLSVSSLRRIWPTSSIILYQNNGEKWPNG